MAENSKIAWTDHTFNSWIGCTKVSEGCKFCYAEELMDKRYRKVEWGPQGARVKTSPANWKKPVQWNKTGPDTFRECAVCGWRGNVPDGNMGTCGGCGRVETLKPARQRVFCASLADVFEDHPQTANWRGELFQLIEQTPNLDWLLLTKRPEMIFGLGTDAVGEIFDLWLARHPNVWIGTSVEDQKTWDERVPKLMNNLAHIRFVSIEPLLSPVWISAQKTKLNWIIVGGESGRKARNMNIEWARSIRDDCLSQGIRFFMKQLGGRVDKREDMADFPEDLQIREFPR